jgi:hypothetical protein
MARGRHRVTPPLHRLLAPLTVASFAVAVAVLAWFSPLGVNGRYPRALVGLAALAACWGAITLRRWDRAAGRRVAELTTARTRDEWRNEERVAELETDLEESRDIRQRLETEVRAKRAELARLRGEHAALLRRYATAESERARALESRRRLAIEAGTAPRALGPATPAPPAPAVRVGPAAYLKADEALRHLSRNAARQQAMRTVEDARRREAAAADADGDEPHGRHAPRTAGAVDPQPARDHRLVSAVASAVVPYAQQSRTVSRAQGGFDFFGVTKQQAAAAEARPAGERPAAEVIDLTAHDETEQLDVRELRAHS